MIKRSSQLAAALAVAALAAWRHSQPADRLNPRLIPWMWITLIAVTVVVVMLVHLVNMLGIETGRR